MMNIGILCFNLLILASLPVLSMAKQPSTAEPLFGVSMQALYLQCPQLLLRTTGSTALVSKLHDYSASHLARVSLHLLAPTQRSLLPMPMSLYGDDDRHARCPSSLVPPRVSFPSDQNYVTERPHSIN